MKTENGNNKSERQINKLIKYMGVYVSNRSNNYFKIDSFNKPTFIVRKGSYNYVEKFDSYAINPMNSKSGKAIWVKQFAATEVYNKDGILAGLIFNAWDGNLLELNELSKGHEDILNLNDYLDQVFIKKN